MSKSVNKVILLGNIGQIETKALSTGTLLTTASLATNDRFKQGEEWKERTEWHTVLFYGRLAEIARDYMHKGSKVYVEGRIRTDSWEDKASGQKRYRTQVVAMELALLDGRSESHPPSAPAPATKTEQEKYWESVEANDIPF